eukprot:s2507_g1.t3
MADASRPQDGSNGQAASSTPLSSCHYEALGITAKDRASEEDIKKAYRTKSREWHPDKNPDNPQATANFQRINEAYNVLKDEGKRRTYNAKIWIEKVYAYIGPTVQPETNVVTWVQNALQVPGNAVDSLIANRHCVQYHITPKMLYLRTQCAVDALICHPTMSHDKSVILISGQPNNVKLGKDRLELTMKEAQCTVAPSDGIVLIAPPQYGADRVMQMSNTAQYTITSLGGGFVSHYADRIMLRMCPRMPGVVAQFQSWMNFSATILMPDGRKLTCWQYAHWCETQNVAAPGMLPPDDPPDGTWVKDLMTFALPAGMERDQSLLQLALLCLQQVPLTTPVIRAISSHPVHAEFSQRSTPQQKARFLCGLAHLDDNTHNKLNIRFSCLANLKVLRRLRQDLAKQQDSIIIRSRAFIAVKDAVPDDAIWHSWDELLKQDGALAKFFLELKKSMKERTGLDLPANWHEIPDVMTMILRTCGGTVQVDLQKGLLRTPEPVAAEKDKSERTPVKETEDESDSSLTSSERIEDAVYELYDSAGPARGYLDMKEVVQHLEKRLKDFRKFSSSWSTEKHSFELQTVSNGSVQVKLTQGAMECAEMRKADRNNSRLRQREIQVAAQILPKLTENIPTNLSQTELCAILVQAGETKSWGHFRPAAVLAILVPEATKDKQDNVTLLKAISPFHASHLMRSIVRCEATCSDNKFKAESLLRLIHVSALDIFHAKAQGGKPQSLLPVVTESLRAMIHKPFSEVVKSRKPQIVVQCFVLAGYRALQEMSAGFVMSKTYSTFNAFAEFVQAIANFYSTFRKYMPEAKELGFLFEIDLKVNKDGKPEGVGVKDADGVVPQIIEKLKTSCQLALKQKNHPEDPQGLHRLVWTFANFGHEFEQIREPSVKPALQMLSELLCSLDFKEETGWTVMILAALVTSYRMAGVASEALFSKIALALTELVKKSAKFKRDHVMRTVEAFKDVGFPKLLDGFLNSLRTKQWFKNELRNSPKDDIPPLLLAMVRVKDAAAVEEFTNFLSSCSHVSEFSFKDISALMKELHDVPASTNATNARGILWRAAMTQLDRKKTLPAPEGVENLLQAMLSPDPAWRFMGSYMMTRICGINLVPMDKERAMLAGSLARCALELGHPSVRTFGINPYKRVNKYLLLVYALIYMGSRGITKFFIKLLVKKVAPRTFVKAADMAPLVIEVLINVLFNFITVRYAMSEVMICSIGPSATVEVTSQLIKAHRQTSDVEEPLSDRVKLLALRAVGVSITYKMQMHPNSRVLLNHIVELFADERFVKRATEEYGDMLARRAALSNCVLQLDVTYLFGSRVNSATMGSMHLIRLNLSLEGKHKSKAKTE